MVVDGLQSQHNHYHFCDRFESGMSDVFLHLDLCAILMIDLTTYQHKSKAQPAKSKEPGQLLIGVSILGLCWNGDCGWWAKSSRWDSEGVQTLKTLALETQLINPSSVRVSSLCLDVMIPALINSIYSQCKVILFKKHNSFWRADI